MAAFRTGADFGRSSEASGGVRQFSRSARDAGAIFSALLELHQIPVALMTITISVSGANTFSSVVTSIEGTTVETTRISDSISSTPTMVAARTFSHGRLTHGPRTARSLHRRTANTVVLGSRSPASACTAVVISPNGACGIRTMAAATTTITA